MVHSFDAVVIDYVSIRCDEASLPVSIDITGCGSCTVCEDAHQLARCFLDYLKLFGFDNAVNASPGRITCLPDQFDLFLVDCAFSIDDEDV